MQTVEPFRAFLHLEINTAKLGYYIYNFSFAVIIENYNSLSKIINKRCIGH